MKNNPRDVSRADQVRARRKIEKVQRKPIPRPVDRTSRDANNASRVVSRHSTYHSTGTYTSSNRQRRQVYLPTGTPGSELRLPTLPRLSFSWRWLSFALSLVMVVLLYMMLNSATFEVNTVNLTGGIRVPSDEVKAILNVTGDSIIRVKPAQVEEQILATFPDIKSAKVEVALPDTLNVVIEERIPAILWLENEQELFWIDQEGFTFSVRGDANLPIRVNANTPPPYALGYVDPKLVEAANATADEPEKPTNTVPPIDPTFVQAIQKLNGIKPTDTPMLFDAENGLGWTDPHGWQVYFGTRTEDIDMKLIEYSHIVDAILDKNLQPVLISMEFLHAPFYRLEP
jgi:hypothetical protein